MELDKRFIDIQFDITQSCNLRCVHCYHPHHNNEGALKYHEWLLIVEKCKIYCEKLRVIPRFLICGGEPTLCHFIEPLLGYLRSHFLESPIIVLTNGTMITNTIIDMAIKYQLKFQVSLDGAEGLVHDKVRGNGQFYRAVSGIKLLKKHQLNVSILSVLMKNNVNQIEKFFELGKELGVNSVNFVRLIGSKNKGFSEDHLFGLELEAAYKRIWCASKRTGVHTITDGPLWYLIDSSLGSGKRLGYYDLIFNYKGYVKVSSRTDYVLGNGLKDDLIKLSQHQVLKKLRAGKIDVCSKCSINKMGKCSGDRSLSYAWTGSYNGPDPGCWLIKNEGATVDGHQSKANGYWNTVFSRNTFRGIFNKNGSSKYV